ncbi:fas-binding factor 1 homolog [Chiloscyllium plagiosum]|uniref:fas-binding factor 1 homolog n=1 Tax=Chiloscyllium plagiosum TaxID=36176 RepID=UPI001CB7D70C|nr:fas-binding factor 1 homolog [Chiloscyllium plagiosum]
MKGSKYKKGFRESIDDVLDDLLGKDDASPSKTASPVTKSGGNLKTSSRTSRKYASKQTDSDCRTNKHTLWIFIVSSQGFKLQEFKVFQLLT